MKRIITLLFCLSLLTTVALAESIQDGSSGAIMKPHNELDGLNEGDYQHLTVLEKDVAINGSDTLDFTAKTVTVVDSVTVGTPELTISGDGLGNVTAAAASLTFNADVEFTGNVLGLPAVITNHNDLSGLNEADYQHLTQAELLELQGLDTNYVATSSLVTTLLNYAALNGDSEEDFAIDHLSADTASFTSNVDVGGELSVGAATDMTIIGDGAGNVTIDTVATLTFESDTDFNGIVDLTDATVIGLPTPVSVHNDLTGLNDGEYQHLTVVEKDQALNGSDSLDLMTNTVDFTDPATTRTNLGLGTMAVETATDYVTDTDLTTALGDYTLTSAFGTMAFETATDYVTSTDLGTTLADYVTSTGLGTILSDYVTTTALGTTLSDYVTSTALGTTLSDYVQTSTLGELAYEDKADYVATSTLTTTLSNYTLTSAFGTMAFQPTTNFVATGTYTAGLADKMDTDGSNAVGIEFFTANEKSVAINGSSTVDFLAEDITATTVTVSDGIDIGSTPDVSVSGDGAGTLTLDAETVEITADLNVTATGTFTGLDVTGTADFTGATVTGLDLSSSAHNDLDGLNDGDYQHLTVVEKDTALNGSASVSLLADDLDVYGDFELAMDGNITGAGGSGFFTPNKQVIVASGNTLSAAQAGMIYSLHNNTSSGTVTLLKGLELWFGSAAATGGVVTTAKGLIVKPIAMGGGTVTTMTAIEIPAFAGGNQYTTAYGLRSSLATVVDKTTYNIYADGTAPNYLKGDTKIDGDVILTPKSAPSGATAGAIYYDSDDNHFYGYNGTSWVQLDN
jgi:hypothetical protein